MIIVKKKRPKQTDDLFHASEKLSFLMVGPFVYAAAAAF
jgi:hypothetical protein